MTESNGVYTTPCTVNGLKLKFIFDTGASKVSISLSEALFMLKNGYLDESDLNGSSFSQLANGSIVENTTVTLREIEIGGLIIHDVEAIIIHELSAPLLLGQSAIQQLGPIKLEGDILIINQGISPEDFQVNVTVTRALINSGDEYYNEKNYYLAVKDYQKAIDIHPWQFRCNDLFRFGFSYYSIDEYKKAISILSRQEDICADYLLFYLLAECHQKLENHEQSIVYSKRALYYATNEEDRYLCNYIIADGYFLTSDYANAIFYFEKAIDYKLKNIGVTEEDLIKGKVIDFPLGHYYFGTAWSYHGMNMYEKFKRFLILSALCGNDHAIEGCKEKGFTY